MKDVVTNGTFLQEKNTEKISLDYTYCLGQIDGLNMAISMIKDISSIMDEESEENKDDN